jgi:hypothetical protein
MHLQMASFSPKSVPTAHQATSLVIKTFRGPVNVEAVLSKPGRPSRQDARAESEVLELLGSIAPQADIDTLSRTMSSIDDLVLSGNLVGLNRVIRKADVKALEPIALLTLLRTTISMRELLPDWSHLRDKAYRAIKRKRLAVDKLMSGLLDT